MILSWEKTKELLEKYQIPMVESLVIKNLGQGTEFANRAGFPVVLKIISSDVLHKIDKGLVRLNIKNEKELEAHRANLSKNLGLPYAELLIQKQISGIELFVGMKRDKSFGPVISFGLGGIFVEVLEDIVFGICPVDKKQVLEMIKKIKGYKILQGYRGKYSVNLEKLADILVNVSRLAIENKEISEIDINPLFAQGSEIVVADAKLIA